MTKCAFLGTEGLLPTHDDGLAVPHLEKRGWSVDHVEWRCPSVDWNAFDLVVVRSTWNYPAEPQRFLEVLQAIEDSRATLCNPFEVMRANLDKTYLRKLEAAGVPIVPTVWGHSLSQATLASCFSSLACEELIVKPTIGAGASGIFKLQKSAPFHPVLAHFQNRAFMAQPLVASIPQEGESSLIYFDGNLSHAVQKIPGPDEFRVQEDFGGSVVPMEPDFDMVAIGAKVMATLSQSPSYARVDLARAPQEAEASFWLMELELIEPSLFLSTASHAVESFVDALVKDPGQKR